MLLRHTWFCIIVGDERWLTTVIYLYSKSVKQEYKSLTVSLISNIIVVTVHLKYKTNIVARDKKW